jgi:DHA2 family multidrug resistance protein
MACGQAHNLWELVAFRFIQGIGGGALLSTSQAILFETYTVEQRGFASAIFGIGVFIGPTIGPTVGGWIIDNYSWPWIFYINMPIGILAVVLSYLYVKEPTQVRASHSVDWTGIALLITGLAALQTVLERGESEDWFSAQYIVVLTIVASVALITFIFWELKTEHPVVDLHVLVKSRSLATAASLTFVLGFALFSTVFIVPVFAQRFLNFTALQTGLLFLPGAGVAIIILPLIGKMLTKGVPSQLLIVVGFFVGATSFFLAGAFGATFLVGFALTSAGAFI